MDSLWSSVEKAQVERMTVCSAVGSPATVQKQLAAIIESTKADELILTSQLHDHEARLKSFELISRLQVETPERTQPGIPILQ